ncbi:hypothetical protein H4S08_000811, partial [Coemansia sp. RSA 1365]
MGEEAEGYCVEYEFGGALNPELSPDAPESVARGNDCKNPVPKGPIPDCELEDVESFGSSDRVPIFLSLSESSSNETLGPDTIEEG